MARIVFRFASSGSYGLMGIVVFCEVTGLSELFSHTAQDQVYSVMEVAISTLSFNAERRRPRRPLPVSGASV